MISCYFKEAPPTFGSEYIFNSVSTTFLSCATLDSTHFVIYYSDENNTDSGTAIIGTVSGSTISFGSKYVFNTIEVTIQTDCKVIDSTHFLLNFTYSNGDNSFSQAVIGSITGSVIAFGSSVNFADFDYLRNDGTACCVKNATSFIVLYYDEDNSHYGTMKVGTISGDVISFSDSYAINDDSTYNLACDIITSTNFIICYRDYSNGNYGTSLIGTVT
jgi:hypothetical protein